VNERPSLRPGNSSKPTWWGIVVAFCSLVAAIAVVAIARGWL
jgi:hypothetical protein